MKAIKCKHCGLPQSEHISVRTTAMVGNQVVAYICPKNAFRAEKKQ